MSEMLHVGRDAIFQEYRKALQSARFKKNLSSDATSSEQSVTKPEPFTSLEILAGYIFRYELFDLFFREFRYTLADLS